jgi:excinuclease ABC subunit C
LGQCLAPCINKISDEVYNSIKKQIDDFFSGKNKQILERLKQLEQIEAKKTNFEEAQKYKELSLSITNLFNLKGKNILFKEKSNIDIIGFFVKDD